MFRQDDNLPFASQKQDKNNKLAAKSGGLEDKKMRAAFYTLGCKVNQYETEILMGQFALNGFDIVSCEDEADVYIVNSCTVTSSGDKKTRQSLRKFKRNNPSAVIALTGCYPQAFPDIEKAIPEADIITGSYNRSSLVPHVKRFLQNREKITDITPHQKGESFEKMSASKFLDHTRAFVKIEDGCDRYCSYCIIPTARGPIRSKLLSDIKDELIGLAENGYKEVVLVGINLSSYGKDLGLRLIDAIELACDIDGIERVRLGSLEPELLTDKDIIRMSKQPKFCPQFHLSLQSGCDETLSRMNRHYDTAEYQRIVTNLRNHFENASITTDIMVGFPGETQEEFQKSIDFSKTIGFAKAHVFAYSKREGTVAARMQNQIDRKTKEQRSAQMIETTNQTKQAFLDSQTGTVQPVLFETMKSNDVYEGYTPNYTPVVVKSSVNLCGKIKYVKLISVENEHCIGEMSEYETVDFYS
ncbi:MAG: mtaB [Oscillospiraceae bacterium]|jgi:threonylcarbamoyladenosine tRNA methylthiotransferase MtaB|nr:mtaB [Oscillospiraceae bacterium]